MSNEIIYFLNVHTLYILNKLFVTSIEMHNFLCLFFYIEFLINS